MCYAGGPRCDKEGRVRLESARTRYRVEASPENYGKLQEAEQDYYLTREGIAALRTQAAEEREQGNEQSAQSIELRADTLNAKREALLALRKSEAQTDSHATAEPTAFTKKYDNPRDAIKAYQDELSERIEKLGEDENYMAYLHAISLFHTYSPTNQLLISIQKPEATHVAGFRTWEKLDRHVKKGEKSIKILAPVKWSKDTGEEDEDGNKVIKDGIGFKAVSVFDISQTEGKALASWQEPTENPTAPEGFLEDLTTACEQSGYKVRYEELAPGLHGYTSHKGEIVINTRYPAGSQVKTLAHELGHVKAGHMERSDYHQGQGGHRGDMEVEAESIAYVLSRANGMAYEMSDYSATYIKGWSGKNPEHIKASAFTVSRVVKDLLGNFSFRNATSG